MSQDTDFTTETVSQIRSSASEYSLFTFNKKSGWIDKVRKVPSPNFDERPGHSEIEVIVVHSISLPPREYGGPYIERLFANQLDFDEHPYFQQIRGLCVSAHFLIYRTGCLTQFVPVNKRAWHAGTSSFHGRESVNDFSVGIELEGCDQEPFEFIQYEVLAGLISCLKQDFPGIRPEGIVGHCDVSPGRKTDPGPLFDWRCLRDELEQQS